MTHAYITPETMVTHIATTQHLLEASPEVTLGTGKRSSFDAKNDATTANPTYNVWDDDWSE